MGSKIITAGIAASALLGAAIALSAKKQQQPTPNDLPVSTRTLPQVAAAQTESAAIIEELQQSDKVASFDADTVKATAVSAPELEEIADLDEGALDIIAKMVNQEIEFEEKPIGQQRGA